jgi:hypothetical protein
MNVNLKKYKLIIHSIVNSSQKILSKEVLRNKLIHKIIKKDELTEERFNNK